MRASNLGRAIDEANRFLERAKRLYGEHRKAEAVAKRAGNDHIYSPLSGSRLSGDVKRASMDLTRALTDLRRHG